jgi:hypothetical protein
MSPEQAYGGVGYGASQDTIYRTNSGGFNASPNLPSIQALDHRPHIAVPPPQPPLPNMMGMGMAHHMPTYYMTPGSQYMPQQVPRYAALPHGGRSYVGTPKKVRYACLPTILVLPCPLFPHHTREQRRRELVFPGPIPASNWVSVFYI